jgi:hypothetical protein
MKTFFTIALLASGLVTSAGWAAQPIVIRAATAGELAENCGVNPRDPAADAKLNFCVGFAQGAIDVELHYAGDKKPFCIPKPGPTRQATMKEFANWVRAIPDRGSLEAAPGLFKFMGERFPCK